MPSKTKQSNIANSKKFLMYLAFPDTSITICFIEFFVAAKSCQYHVLLDAVFPCEPARAGLLSCRTEPNMPQKIAHALCTKRLERSVKRHNPRNRVILGKWNKCVCLWDWGLSSPYAQPRCSMASKTSEKLFESSVQMVAACSQWMREG